MPCVFIPNSASHDYADAERFGKLIPLTEGNIDLSNVSKIYRTVMPILDNACCEDYILISGASVVNGIVCGIFAAKFKKLNLLIYRRNGKYVERNISLED